jgi:capsular exopolysaccharide synthesis family protein
MSPSTNILTGDKDYLLKDASARVHSGNVLRIDPHNKSRLVFLTEPVGLAVEQYKLLRRRLNARNPLGGVVLITSPGPGEGKTLTSVNLSWCLANGGQHTCLVDLDFRAPGVSSTLGYSVGHVGVEDVLAGKAGIGESLCQVGDNPLYVLGMRKQHSSPEEFLSAAVLTPLLTCLRAMFHWVILDLAPAIPMSDVAEVVPHVDGALMVIRERKTKKKLIGSPCEILGAKLWGVVLNDSPIVGSAYYGDYGNSKFR